MIRLYDWFCRRILGRNTKYTPIDLVAGQLIDRRPLPIGVAEFNEWADRIISGALLPVERDSQVYALATMIMTLGPHESHKEDAYFIHGLRKSAANQVADDMRKELYAAKKLREESDKKAKEAAAANPAAEATLERAKGLKLVPEVLDNK